MCRISLLNYGTTDLKMCPLHLLYLFVFEVKYRCTKLVSLCVQGILLEAPPGLPSLLWHDRPGQPVVVAFYAPVALACLTHSTEMCMGPKPISNRDFPKKEKNRILC
jgi:hypothetical protein